MKFETKYDLGDKVYMLYNNQIREVLINKVQPGYVEGISSKSRSMDIYRVKTADNKYEGVFDKNFTDKDLFPTKEDLINSL